MEQYVYMCHTKSSEKKDNPKWQLLLVKLYFRKKKDGISPLFRRGCHGIVCFGAIIMFRKIDVVQFVDIFTEPALL